jgi:hypothetical protein
VSVDDFCEIFRGQKSFVARDMLGTTSPPMKQMERREWWLWSFVVIITLLLTAGIAAFALLLLRSETDRFYGLNIQELLRGLLGLVLLFDIYSPSNTGLASFATQRCRWAHPRRLDILVQAQGPRVSRLSGCPGPLPVSHRFSGPAICGHDAGHATGRQTERRTAALWSGQVSSRASRTRVTNRSHQSYSRTRAGGSSWSRPRLSTAIVSG